MVFGQELPDAGASIVDQTFALLVAFVGLATFALVLALVEQVVLEVSLGCKLPCHIQNASTTRPAGRQEPPLCMLKSLSNFTRLVDWLYWSLLDWYSGRA